MLKEKKIGLIGAGSMAASILAGLTEKGEILPQNIALINRCNQKRLQELTQLYGLNEENNKPERILEADIVILAVKPKDVAEVLKCWGNRFRQGQLIISVIAGISTSFLESGLKEKLAVIRVMPNTSCAVGLSATAVCSGKWVRPEDMEIACHIFSAIGSVFVVQEEMMDAVTGLSGSGPAYFYYMVEALESAGVHAGLSAAAARDLTVQTLLGAAQMLVKTGKEASQLRREVTSPGGTTMAGLEVLSRYRFDEAVIQAVLRAKERSREMGRDFASSR
ncbi:pyrroline-5-carboxylate reductase [Paenactinomyces guangxiensis]|uniref:Pyrroline-5-carboxylate reductase n=1 Tax=Paenactinomyces guangxiensis TaxID=1490290 RepID=A0A7W1WTC5_9BACL|nr:pyrroline-5-carboxylate reductase [Paenactinomyces guangxiensis]MBA4495461.1 pyrroline-5-carboxylate reductase [Paenactinomyces guangxiensis]MBH8592416.1 pyrroline-5-carboxylate reductase [Paenactinomyces guangxiensis]